MDHSWGEIGLDGEFIQSSLEYESFMDLGKGELNDP